MFTIIKGRRNGDEEGKMNRSTLQGSSLAPHEADSMAPSQVRSDETLKNGKQEEMKYMYFSCAASNKIYATHVE